MFDEDEETEETEESEEDNDISESEEAEDVSLNVKKQEPQPFPQQLDPEENYDFDFSLYDEEEERAQEEIESVSFKKPQVTNLKSRFSNGQAELDKLAEINVKVSEVGIKIAARTQNINVVWLYYGLLDELWACMKNVPGEAINKIILRQKKRCLDMIMKSDKGLVDYSVHNNLLYLRDMVYYVKQRLNLGIEVEKFKGSTYGKAKRAITEV